MKRILFILIAFWVISLSAQYWAHPVIDKGIMYIRHGSVFMAYKIK